MNSIFSTNLLLFQCSQINKWQLILPTSSPKSTVPSYTIVPSALLLPQYSFIFILYYIFYCFVSFHLQRRSLRVGACRICLNPEHLAQCMLHYLYKEAVNETNPEQDQIPLQKKILKQESIFYSGSLVRVKIGT